MSEKPVSLGSTRETYQLPVWLIGFFVSPVIAALFALLHRNELGAKVVTCLFVGLFGFIMSTDDQAMDLYRYLHSLHNLSTTNSISSVFSNLYSSGPSSISDLYAPLLQAIVGLVTDNAHFLMLVFGLIFGLFYSKTITLLSKPKIETLFSFGLLFLFINVFGIQGLAGVRFYTAFYVYFFGVISYINTSKRIYLLSLVGACLIHFSYIFAVLLFGIYYILRNKPRIILGIAVLSFFITATSFSNIVSEYSSIFGGAIEAKANIYSSENDWYVDYIQDSAADNNWYISLKSQISFWVAVASLFLFYLFKKRFQINQYTQQYLLLILIFLFFRNLTFDIPDLGIRFNNIFIAGFYFFLYHFYVQNSSNIIAKAIAFLNLAGGILIVLYSIRSIFFYVQWYSLFISPIIMLFA